MPNDYWNLNTLWFALIAVLWIGFFVLEGFDFGVGILTRFLGKDDLDRRVMINTIGPVWDGNEVWLLVAGGATFAAFPEWYATLFSGFYLALFLVLAALIFRGVALEFRSKIEGPRWRRLWDEAIFWGSALPALLFGVAFANVLRGVPIDANKEFVGSFFDLLNPYALVGGLTSLTVFTLHGAVFLSLKTREEIAARARSAARLLSLPAAAFVVAFLVWSYLNATAANNTGVVPGFVPVAAIAAAIGAAALVRERRDGWAFVSTGLTIVLVVATIFLNLYPRVMVSSLSPAYSLTIFSAASTPYTLTVMSIVAAIFTPIVLAYQGWTYWVFRGRIGRADFERGRGGQLSQEVVAGAPHGNGTTATR